MNWEYRQEMLAYEALFLSVVLIFISWKSQTSVRGRDGFTVCSDKPNQAVMIRVKLLNDEEIQRAKKSEIEPFRVKAKYKII